MIYPNFRRRPDCQWRRVLLLSVLALCSCANGPRLTLVRVSLVEWNEALEWRKLGAETDKLPFLLIELTIRGRSEEIVGLPGLFAGFCGGEVGFKGFPHDHFKMPRQTAAAPPGVGQTMKDPRATRYFVIPMKSASWVSDKDPMLLSYDLRQDKRDICMVGQDSGAAPFFLSGNTNTIRLPHELVAHALASRPEPAPPMTPLGYVKGH